MKGAITSKEERTAGNVLLFDINENDYRPEGVRIVTRNQVLDGSTLITDWGYSETNKRISLGNIYLSKDKYDDLIAIKEDNSHTFYFHYMNSTWRVVVERVDGPVVGSKRNVTMLLDVVEKIADGETS